MKQPSHCATCNAPLNTRSAVSGVVVCGHCGAEAPLVGLGALLVEADLADPRTPGFTRWMTEGIRWEPGPPPTLVADVPGDGQSYEVLTSSGVFDDFEASATLRFPRGDYHTHGGLKFRRQASGLYQLAVNNHGEASLYHLAVGQPARAFAPWGPHASVRAGEPNTLQVVCRGDRIRAFVNGGLVASVRDGASPFGAVSVFGQANAPSTLGFSSLTIREPRGD